MKLEAAVKVENGVAYFALSPSGQGFYKAELIRYEGPPHLAPPSRIMLIRGSVNNWTGTWDRPELLQTLGHMIDDINQNAPIFQKGTDIERSPDKTGSPEK